MTRCPPWCAQSREKKEEKQKIRAAEQTVEELVSRCYDLITQVTTLGLRLEDGLGVRGRECTIY